MSRTTPPIMISTGPKDIAPSASRPTEHLLMAPRHGGAPMQMSLQQARRAPPAPMPAGLPAERSRGAARQQQPVFDGRSGEFRGFRESPMPMQRPPPQHAAPPPMRGAGRAAPMAPQFASDPRQFDPRQFQQTEAPAFARGGTPAFDAPEPTFDPRWTHPEQAPMMSQAGAMRGAAEPGAFAGDDEPSHFHGGALSFEEDRMATAIAQKMTAKFLEIQRAQGGARATGQAEAATEPAPFDDGHTIPMCAHGGCDVCLAGHPDGCRCTACCTGRRAGRAPATAAVAPAAPAPTKQRPATKKSSRGPRPQDL